MDDSIDYRKLLQDDLPEQFKGQPVISALCNAVGRQLNEAKAYCDELKGQRTIATASGKQLDYIGNIVGLTRKEAAELACIRESVYSLPDEVYRKFIIYKVWLNNSSCTYSDIMGVIGMFWDKPLHYSEKATDPATIILETEELRPEDDSAVLFNVPIVKASGVGVKVIVYTVADTMSESLDVTGSMFGSLSKTELPAL